jgi:hypothetical protein
MEQPDLWIHKLRLEAINLQDLETQVDHMAWIILVILLLDKLHQFLVQSLDQQQDQVQPTKAD